MNRDERNASSPAVLSTAQTFAQPRTHRHALEIIRDVYLSLCEQASVVIAPD